MARPYPAVRCHVGVNGGLYVFEHQRAATVTRHAQRRPIVKAYSFEGGKMDELTLLAGREETPSPAWITAAAVTAAFATSVPFFASAVFAQPASNSLRGRLRPSAGPRRAITISAMMLSSAVAIR